VPERPDVEGFRRFFDEHAAGKQVRRVSRVDRSMLRETTPTGLGRALRRRRLGKARPHGKLLMCPTGRPTLVLHFGMTGLLVWSATSRRVIGTTG
jgi:formamidopyrimidine-DNA glycosylase